MEFEIYKDIAGEWRWQLVADNGNIVADSAEGYKNKLDCMETLHSILLFAREIGYPVIKERDE